MDFGKNGCCKNEHDGFGVDFHGGVYDDENYSEIRECVGNRTYFNGPANE